MGKSHVHPIPARDPVSGGQWIVTELTCEDSGVVLRGRFSVPRYSRLDAEQAHFLETFLRCRGMLNSMERELGISYPTVRARLDALLEALELSPAKEPNPNGRDKRAEKLAEKRNKILEKLERGEISPAEAMEKIRGGNES